jgi:hypothetical protein
MGMVVSTLPRQVDGSGPTIVYFLYEVEYLNDQASGGHEGKKIL